jgi:hypothetical protein
VILAYLNPFIAQADVMCGTEATFSGGWCSAVSGLAPSNDGVVFLNDGGMVPGITKPDFTVGDGKGGIIVVEGDQAIDAGGREFAAEPNQPFGVARDALWPKSIVTWLVLSIFFILLSVQAVSPTRRWRPRRRARTPRSAAE